MLEETRSLILNYIAFFPLFLVPFFVMGCRGHVTSPLFPFFPRPSTLNSTGRGRKWVLEAKRESGRVASS